MCCWCVYMFEEITSHNQIDLLQHSRKQMLVDEIVF